MEFIAFSDSHFYHNPSKSRILEDGGYSWLKSQLDCLGQIFEYAKENNIGWVVFNGDLFEEKNKVNAQVYNKVWEKFYLFTLSTFGLKITFNTGNHDFINYNRLSLLKPFTPYVDIITGPQSDDRFEDVLFTPYGMLTDEIVDNKDGYEILFTHEEFYGLDAGYTIKSKYKVSDFSNWKHVFNGHIHKPQEIGNMWNIGSMMQQDWGEEGQFKRFIHYKDGDIKSIRLIHPHFITFDSVVFDDITTMSTIPSDDIDFFRINIDSSQLNHDIFKRWNVKPNITKALKKEIRLESNLTIEDEVEKYVEISDTSLNKDKLKSIAKEFIRKSCI